MLETDHSALGYPKGISVRNIGQDTAEWLEGITVTRHREVRNDGCVCYTTPLLSEHDLDTDILHSGDNNEAHTVGIPGFLGGQRIFHGMRGIASILQAVGLFAEERRLRYVPHQLKASFEAPVFLGDTLRIFLQETDQGNGRNFSVEAIRDSQGPVTVIQGNIRLQPGDPNGWYVPLMEGLWRRVSTRLGTKDPGPGTIYTGLSVLCSDRLSIQLPAINRVNFHEGYMSSINIKEHVVPFDIITVLGGMICCGESRVRKPRPKIS